MQAREGGLQGAPKARRESSSDQWQQVSSSMQLRTPARDGN